MAIKINATNPNYTMFTASPDVQVDITLEDGEHQWTLHGGGAVLLQAELSRYLLATQDILNMMKNTDNDDKTGEQLRTEMHAGWNRFKRCFNANMTSEDGSAERWIAESQYDFVTMPTILQEILQQAQGGKQNA